jgi:hypothetical protein
MLQLTFITDVLMTVLAPVYDITYTSTLLAFSCYFLDSLYPRSTRILAKLNAR